MGKLVNVVLGDGTVTTVSEEDAARLTAGNYGHQQTTDEATSDSRSAVRERENSGLASKARAFVEGGLDAATFGGYGKARDAVATEDETREARDAAQVNPGSRFLGEAATMLAPTGVLGEGAKGLSELSALGVAGKAGGAIGGVAGRAVEGALIGAGGHVASTNVTGDPLTIEGLVEGAGVGAIFNVGAGALADGLLGVAKKATTVSTEAKSLADDYSLVQKGNEVWRNPPDSWEPFTEAVKARQAAAQDAFDEATAATEKYQKFIKGGQLDNQITKAENAINSISRRWNEDIVLPPEQAPGVEGFDTSDAAAPATRAPDASGMGFDTSDVGIGSTPQEPAPPVNELAGRTTREVFNKETGEYVTQVKQEAPEVAAPADGRPPISQDLQARLKGFRDRLRRIDQMRAGGWELDANVQTKYGPSEWVKNPAFAPNPEKAVEELRSLQNDLRQQFPKATRKVKFGEIPETPPKIPPEPEQLRLPKTLKELSKQKPDTIQKIGNAVATDPTGAAGQAWERLANDLGVTPTDGIAGLHNKLGGYISAEQRIAATAAKKAGEDSAEGLIPFIRKGLKKFTVYGTARAADAALGGGLPGAAGRVFAGEGARVAMDKFEESALAGVMMKAKLGTEQRLGKLIAKIATPASKVTKELGPITAYLQGNVFTGEQDTEKDIRKLAIKRIAELNRAALTADNTVYSAMQPLLGDPSDAAWKIHNHVTSAVKYLALTAPKDPGTVTHMFGSDWLPSHQDATALAHRIEAVFNPFAAMTRSISGDGHPAATEALWQAWPALMQRAGEEVGHNALQLGGLTYEKAQGYSDTFRAPLTGLQEPSMMMQLQSIYLPKPQQPASPGGGGGGSPRPTGRPAAVQSSVAGSNVSSLISQ